VTAEILAGRFSVQHRVTLARACFLAMLLTGSRATAASAQAFVSIELDDVIQSGAAIEEDSRVRTVYGRLVDTDWRPAIRFGAGILIGHSLAVVADVSAPRPLTGGQLLRNIPTPFPQRAPSCVSANVTTAHRDVLANGLLRREFTFAGAPKVRAALFGGGGVAFRRTDYDGTCIGNSPNLGPVNYPYSRHDRSTSAAFTVGGEELFRVNEWLAIGGGVRLTLVDKPIWGIGSRIIQFGAITELAF